MAGSIWDWSLTASENDTADADIDWREGMFPDIVNDSARMMMQRVAALLKDLSGSLTSSGTANALTLTANSQFTALKTGMRVSFTANASNTGTATININGTGPKAIRKVGAATDVAIAAGDIIAGQIYHLVYSTGANSNAGGWILQNPMWFPQLTIGSGATQSNALLKMRAPGNNIEFGHSNLAGYGSVIGCDAGNGSPWVAFYAEAGTDINSYRTRGFPGFLIKADRGSGTLQFQAVKNAEADNQSATTLASLDQDGNWTLKGNKIDAFPSGTRWTFHQAAAPTGWTKLTHSAYNDAALRVVTGTAGATAGSVAFTTAFQSAVPTTSTAVTVNVAGTALTIAQLPAHTHGSGTLAGVTNTTGAHSHRVNAQSASGAQSFLVANSSGSAFNPSTTVDGDHSHTVDVNSGATASIGNGATHTHTASSPAHSHTINLAVKYIDVIVCEKA